MLIIKKNLRKVAILACLAVITFFSGCKDDTEDNNDSWNKFISYIMYEEDGVSEYQKIEYSYDSQGRRFGMKAYSLGELGGEFTNFSYNGKECTYTSKSYSSGTLESQKNCKIVYYGNSWDKYISQIEYKEDGVSENYKYEYSYDSKGRTIAIKYYSSGKLSSEQTNFSYKGKECTYIYKSYSSSGTLLSQNNCKIVYYGNSWDKYISYIGYKEDGVSEKGKVEYSYDLKGRPIAYKEYSGGILYLEHTNYSYNENVCTYIYKVYSSGTLQWQRFCKIVYY